METVLSVKNLTKTIKSKSLVKSLSFDISKGEIVGLLGPNGAGKTTTMKMMVGLISITNGEVLVNNESISGNFIKAISKVGAIIENPEFYPFLSGYDNLKYYMNMSGSIDYCHFNEIIELLGLKESIHKKVKTYSLGMRQRLGIAQALIHNPSILILDEPMNGLDPFGVSEMRMYLKKLASEKNLSILVSSHLLSEIELLCDRALIIKNGILLDSFNISTNYEQEYELISEVRFQLDEPNLAKNIVAKYNSNIECSVIKNENQFEELLVYIQRKEIPNIIYTLMVEGIKIYGVHQKRKKLEDVFLDLTRGNIIE